MINNYTQTETGDFVQNNDLDDVRSKLDTIDDMIKYFLDNDIRAIINIKRHHQYQTYIAGTTEGFGPAPVIVSYDEKIKALQFNIDMDVPDFVKWCNENSINPEIQTITFIRGDEIIIPPIQLLFPETINSSGTVTKCTLTYRLYIEKYLLERTLNI